MALQVRLRNFGPIGSGNVRLRPLTVFIGPNNAGKSYLAMLTYAATQRAPHRTSFAFESTKAGIRVPRFRIGYDQPSPDTSRYLLALTEGTAKAIPRPPDAAVEDLQTIIKESLQRYRSDVVAEVERCFGRNLSELSRIGGRRSACSVEIRHDVPSWSISLGANLNEQDPAIGPTEMRKLLNRAARKIRTRRRPLTRDPAEFAWFNLIGAVLDSCFEAFPEAVYYLPAARSGILQSHRLLASLIVGRASYAGIEDMRIGKLAGVLSDFVRHLLTLSPRQSGLKKVAAYLEANVLDGQVLMTGTGPAYPEILYRTGGRDYQLQDTSSMVSELAPVVLFLRHLVDPNEMMIIEEPESHLHPAIQQKLARAIGRLVNAGVQVVLTTHSDYFLTQLNNLILAGSLPDKDRTSAGFSREECLRVPQVSAYFFKPTPNQGTIVSRLRVTQQSGIPQREFEKVARTLYTETVRLERRLHDSD